MDRLDYIVAMLERTLKTRNKRHIIGGALISASLLFGGLALTVVTLKNDEGDEKEDADTHEIDVY